MTKRRVRREFDTSFKLEVVRMVKDQGLSVSRCLPQHGSGGDGRSALDEAIPG